MIRGRASGPSDTQMASSASTTVLSDLRAEQRARRTDRGRSCEPRRARTERHAARQPRAPRESSPPRAAPVYILTHHARECFIVGYILFTFGFIRSAAELVLHRAGLPTYLLKSSMPPSPFNSQRVTRDGEPTLNSVSKFTLLSISHIITYSPMRLLPCASWMMAVNAMRMLNAFGR